MDWFDSWKGWAAAFGEKPGRFFEAGEVRLALLSMLGEAPRHGYELMKELEARSGGLYRASAGAIYPTLQQMEDEGLISPAMEGDRRVYTLTDAGRHECEAQAEGIERIWARARSWNDVGSWSSGVETGMVAMMAGQLVGEAMRAMKRVDGREGGVERVREILEQARRSLRDLGRSGAAAKPGDDG